MPPLCVNQHWFDDYWYGPDPAARRWSAFKNLPAIAACLIALLAAAAVLTPSAGGDHPHAKAHIRFM